MEPPSPTPAPAPAPTPISRLTASMGLPKKAILPSVLVVVAVAVAGLPDASATKTGLRPMLGVGMVALASAGAPGAMLSAAAPYPDE